MSQIRARLQREGPVSVARFMELCLHDPAGGYYARNPGLGGDFLTAPHVSQIFGELLGLWALAAWRGLGSPAPFRLIELGPGEGLMMQDAARAIGRLEPGLAPEVTLVERSPVLLARQAERLAPLEPHFVEHLEEVAPGPLILLANEFLDCLPIDQAERTAMGWRRRAVGWKGGELAFLDGGPAPRERLRGAENLPLGAVIEWSQAVEDLGREIGARLAAHPGAALFLDYGSAGEPPLGDTLQAVVRHRKLPALASPGEADITAHVRFSPFLAAARSQGAATAGPVDQAAFLAALGIGERARRLSEGRPEKAAAIERQMERLTGADHMGRLFQACCIFSRGLAPQGFGP